MKSRISYEKKQIIKRALALTGAIFIITLLIISALPAGQDFWNKIFLQEGLYDYPEYVKDYPLNIFYLDVGKADSIVIECDGEYALLDAGTYDRGNDIKNTLKKIGVESFKYIFASHPDKDHIGSMAEILQSYDTQMYIEPEIKEDVLPDSTEFLMLTNVLENKNIDRQSVTAGKEYSLGSAKIEIVAPVGEYTDTNNYSLVMKLTYKDFSALFCGDIEKEAEEDLLNSGADLNADVLKVAHHGSNSSSKEKFLKAVEAKFAVICVGSDNNNLPKNKVLKRLDEAGMEIFRTDKDGMIIISSDGSEIKIYTQNKMERG